MLLKFLKPAKANLFNFTGDGLQQARDLLLADTELAKWPMPDSLLNDCTPNQVNGE